MKHDLSSEKPRLNRVARSRTNRVRYSPAPRAVLRAADTDRADRAELRDYMTPVMPAGWSLEIPDVDALAADAEVRHAWQVCCRLHVAA